LKNSARLVPLDAISQLKKVLGSPSCNRHRHRYGLKGPVITRLVVGLHSQVLRQTLLR